MNDTFNIPNNELKTQVFYSSASGATNQWQTWSKPSNAKLIHFTVIGGGGGGGGGLAGVLINSGKYGGGGGGSSSITTGLFPASLLPDTLYIQVGSGGAGGAGTPGGTLNNPTSGGTGLLSYVSISANTNFAYIVLASGSVGAKGGSLSTGGNGATIFSVSNSIVGKVGIINSIAGQNGANGGTAAVGSNITITNLPITGGAGGGAAGTSTVPALSFSGGSINAFAFLPRVSGGIVSGGTGSDGYENILIYNNLSNKLPFITTGGAGGGGFLNGSGGKGGNGSYGSGGGGGGSGYNVVPFNGGTGGDGGNGIVIITVF